METREQKQERVDRYVRRQEHLRLGSATHREEVLKEVEEKRLVTYRRRGQDVYSKVVQEECTTKGPALRRSVGKRSATHPCVTDRSLKRRGRMEM